MACECEKMKAAESEADKKADEKRIDSKLKPVKSMLRGVRRHSGRK
jgi:hypothetical protein